MREKKKIAIKGYSPKVCTSTYTHGNTMGTAAFTVYQAKSQGFIS